jgi:outer membrane translocation and assembly module TamA
VLDTADDFQRKLVQDLQERNSQHGLFLQIVIKP